MTLIGMTSHCMTSCYSVHFCIECVERPVPKTCKVSIRYVSWFTRYSTTLIIFRMTLVYIHGHPIQKYPHGDLGV